MKEAFPACRFGPIDGPAPNETNCNFAYLPFGGGRRKCIGDQFAVFEAITALAMLLRRFDFAMAPNAPPVGMTTGATIHTTNGLYMTVKPRENVPPTPPPMQHAATAASSSSNGHQAAADGGCPLHTESSGSGHAEGGHQAATVATNSHQEAAAASNGHHAAEAGGCPFHSAADAADSADCGSQHAGVAGTNGSGNGHRSASGSPPAVNGSGPHSPEADKEIEKETAGVS